jgi:hypothetical protein
MSAVQPFLINTGVWMRVPDGDATALAIFARHYTFRGASRKLPLILGPGEKMVLLTPDARALFAWRKFIADNDQHGVNCAVFRNEGAGLSSELIRSADDLADQRWPGERHYTYVDPRCVRSANPGCCFLKAGYRRCGRTASGPHILERLP